MDPYIVLGLPSGANAFEIKKAYHNAVKLYHSDRFAGTPEYIAAQEKLKTVNLAYDMLAPKLAGSFSGGRGTSSAQSENTSKNDSNENQSQAREEQYEGWEYDRHALKYAYDLAMEKRLSEALLLLSKTKRRGARWHYVHAICRKKAGAFAEAIKDIEIAMTLEPKNLDYRDEWRAIIALRTKRRKRAAVIGAAAAVAATIAVAASV